MCPSLFVCVLLLCVLCVCPPVPVSSAVNTTTSPTTSPSPSPTNPFLSSPPANIDDVTLDTSRPSYIKQINGIVPSSSIVYIQVDAPTASASASASPVNVQLNLINKDGTTQSWFATPVSSTCCYVVIRPGLTGPACAAAAAASPAAGCNFTLQVTTTTPQDIKVTYIHASARPTGTELTASTTFPNVVVYGVELSAGSLLAGLPLSLRVTPFSSPRALDLWVAHETQVDSPLYPEAPKTVATASFVLNPTSAPSPSVSTSKSTSPSTSLFLIAVVPTLNDTSSQAFVLTVGAAGTGTTDAPPQNGGGSQVMATPASYVISFVILAGIAILGFCCFALYLLAKRRRQRLMGLNQTTAAETGPGVLTSGRVVEAQPPPPGITAHEMELIPIHTEPPKAGPEALCSVCLSGYDSCPPQPVPLRTLACGHCYHVSCIDPWLQQHRTCPYCRMDAIPDQKHTLKGTATATATATAPALPPSRVRGSIQNPAVLVASPPLSHSQSPYYVQEEAEDRTRDTDMPDNRV